MMRFLKRLAGREEGLETVEYAIIVGLIVVGTIAVIASIGVWVNSRFVTLQTELGAP